MLLLQCGLGLLCIALVARLLMKCFMAEVYDGVIIRMTARWYKAVLTRLGHKQRLLDIGIGTATALARNAHHVLEKQLTVVGIDYEEAYVRKAAQVVRDAGLNEAVVLHCKSIYDPQLPMLFSGAAKFDAVYFSGSLTLMPDPGAALRAAASMLNDKGLIYVTQTFQNQPSPITAMVKPLLRALTTIDFGVVTYKADMDAIIESSGLSLLEDSPIPGSINTTAQTARMYVLEFRSDQRRC